MDVSKENATKEEDQNLEQGETIDRAFVQMALIYKSRCVQPPHGSNVTIREIKKDE
jgi:hypothetical protein